MIDQQDITAFLRAKLEDGKPKCWNCRYWEQYPYLMDRHATKSASFGICDVAVGKRYYEDVMEPIGVVKTADLSLCSAWERREKAE